MIQIINYISPDDTVQAFTKQLIWEIFHTNFEYQYCHCHKNYNESKKYASTNVDIV